MGLEGGTCQLMRFTEEPLWRMCSCQLHQQYYAAAATMLLIPS